MANNRQTTDYLDLILPKGPEYYSVQDGNNNFIILDTKIEEIMNNITSLNTSINSTIEKVVADLIGGSTEGIDSLKDILDLLNDPESGELVKINQAINERVTNDQFDEFKTEHTKVHDTLNSRLTAIDDSTNGSIVREQTARQSGDDQLNEKIGSLELLKSTNKENIVNSINELIGNIGPLTSLSTIIKTNIVNAINENYTAIREINDTVNSISNDLGKYDKIILNIQTTITDRSEYYTGYVKINAKFNDIETTHNFTVNSGSKGPGYSKLFVVLENYNYNNNTYEFMVGFELSGMPPYGQGEHDMIFETIVTDGESNYTIYGFRGEDNMFTSVENDNSNNVIQELNNIKNNIGDLALVGGSDTLTSAINNNYWDINNLKLLISDISELLKTDNESAFKSIIIGDESNSIEGSYSAILAGINNSISGSNADKDQQFGYPSTSLILGGHENSIDNEGTGRYAIIIGGKNNTLLKGTSCNILSSDNSKINNGGACIGIYTSSYSNMYGHCQCSLIAGGSHNVIGIEDRFCDNSAVIGGSNNKSVGDNAIVIGGCYNTSSSYQTKMGHYSTDGDEGTNSGITGDALIIGNGSSDESRSNAFRVSYNGSIYGTGSYNSSGADYAEMMEWSDGNVNNEDRRGLFVTFDDNDCSKIKIANLEDDVIGIVSSCPSIIGNSYDDNWKGMYSTDSFGTPLTKIIEKNAEYDDDGNLIHDKYTVEEKIINPEYNPEEEYIPRSKRKEWATIGLIGQMIVVDDGTSIPGKKCKCGDNGIATLSDNGGYRVLSRIDENHIKIFIK